MPMAPAQPRRWEVGVQNAVHESVGLEAWTSSAPYQPDPFFWINFSPALFENPKSLK